MKSSQQITQSRPQKIQWPFTAMIVIPSLNEILINPKRYKIPFLMEIQIDRVLKCNCFLDQPVTTWPLPIHQGQNAKKSNQAIKSSQHYTQSLPRKIQWPFKAMIVILSLNKMLINPKRYEIPILPFYQLTRKHHQVQRLLISLWFLRYENHVPDRLASYCKLAYLEIIFELWWTQ